MNALIPLDGPTVLIELAGTRLLIDPTFDAAGTYPIGSRALVKTTDATWTPEQVGQIDAVLLSHDQHPDNLDHGGRMFVQHALLTLTTPAAAQRLGGTARGLEPWASHQVGAVSVTAVPARHGPEGAERSLGPVTGFVLTAEGAPTIYVSGDNASLDLVRDVAARFPVLDIAVLFAGAARTPVIDGYITLDNQAAIEATRLLGGPKVLPVHTDGWRHFTQDGRSLRDAFTTAGLADVLLPHDPGEKVAI